MGVGAGAAVAQTEIQKSVRAELHAAAVVVPIRLRKIQQYFE